MNEITYMSLILVKCLKSLASRYFVNFLLNVLYFAGWIHLDCRLKAYNMIELQISTTRTKFSFEIVVMIYW